MRHIVKGLPPASLTAWKNKGNEDWTPTWSNLQKPEKPELQQALLDEQGWVCCYCGRGVTAAESHIEHFRPQTDYPELALDYGNLHASCLRETKPGLPLHCGHAKDDSFDEALCISPAEQSCESRFRYFLDGRTDLQQTNDPQAQYMLDILNLNSALLRNGRKDVLQGVFDDEFLMSASSEDLERIRDVYSRRDGLKKFPNFGHVVSRYASTLLSA